jgi:hypothetical protein
MLLRPNERTQSRLAFIGIRRSLFIAWCAWLSVLIVGSIVELILEEQEWRETVGVLSVVVGILVYFVAKRMRG